MNRKITSNQPTVGHRPDRLSHPALAAGRIGHAEEPSDDRSYDRADGFSALLRRLLLPMAASAATGLVAVTALTAVAVGSSDPTTMIPLLSSAALLLSSLAGGITAGLCRRERAVAGSLVSGCLLAAVLCFVGLLGGEGSAVSWLIRLAPIPVHAVGGLLTRQRPAKPTHTAGKHLAHRRG